MLWQKLEVISIVLNVVRSFFRFDDAKGHDEFNDLKDLEETLKTTSASGNVFRRASRKIRADRLWREARRGTKETRPPCRKICMRQRAVASDSIIAGQRHTDYVGLLRTKSISRQRKITDYSSCRGLLGPWFLLSVTNVPGHRAYGSGVFQAHDEMRLVPTVYARAAPRNSLPPAR